MPRGQETSTYDRRRVHTTGDEYIRVPRGQETSAMYTIGDEYIRVDTSPRNRVHKTVGCRFRILFL